MPRITSYRVLLVYIVAITGSLFSPAAHADPVKKTTILFIAGRDSHGFGSHEHGGGCRVLAKSLEESLPGVTTVLTTGGWPKDERLLDQADAIVLYMDGGGGHPANRHLEALDKVMKKGVGLTCIHYAVEVPKAPAGKFFLDWIGGYFEKNWSVNPHWVGKFAKFPEHPITRGVQPFEINDEWYYHMRFREGMKGVTPILTAIPPDETRMRGFGSHSGNPTVRARLGMAEHVAWASERPDGGRGFGFTGGHVHWNWGDENFRKLVLNGIAWTAKVEVPKSGIVSKPVDRAALTAAIGRPQKKRGGGKKFNPKKARFASKTVTSTTPGHAVDIDVDIKGAKELWLVVDDGGDGYSCDWADWVEPRLVGPSGEKKLTELKWISAKSGYGDPSVNKNCGGQPLFVDGKPVAYGIGTHAVSAIGYRLPKGYERFKARGALDEGGTGQGACGASTSVRFLVFTSKPPAGIVRAAAADAGTDIRSAANAVAGLDTHEDVEATLFASEPTLLSPTNLDVDARGRVWVCEVVNYRRHNGKRKEGDRILILEDTDGDGKADLRKVYYQGRDIDSAMGICVLGNKVIVSATPNIFIFHDDDGDDLPDRKEVFFTKTGQPQHDHSAHSFLFGPDGKLYWNFGNTGRHVHDRDGNIVVDVTGEEVRDDGKPYVGGMAFRCDMDGSEFEVLGHNFRNNYEVTVDSFGTVWQSDNDDDGNRGVRINYVMEYGNFGYREEGTGRGWNSKRTGITWPIPNAEKPWRHWHLQDPGVVPNLVQTFQGSPTGITVYEGDLLPSVFRNQVIHCDAGPNVVRAYPRDNDGAGYKAEMLDILKGARDKWFRPADVCVAPDGSLFVTDWYDPGVGGHNMRDLDRGRIFRVAPKGHKYKVPKLDVSSIEGAIVALKSPSYAVRYLAWTALHAMGRKAEPALEKLYASKDPVLRARALWLLGKTKGRGEHYAHLAVRDANSDIRIVGLRLARQLKLDIVPLLHELVRDPNPQVRRECAIALRFLESDEVPDLWAELATKHDGKDRWYLEALGIGADKRWDACFAAWEKRIGKKRDSKAGRDIIWRSRTEKTPAYLAALISDPKTPDDEILRYFRSFDFQPSKEKEDVLVALAFSSKKGLDDSRVNVIGSESLQRLKGFDPNKNDDYADALDSILDSLEGSSEFVDLVGRFGFKKRFPDLVKIAASKPSEQTGVDAIRALLGKGGGDAIRKVLDGKDAKTALNIVTVLGNSADGNAVGLLVPVLQDEDREIDLRRLAAKSLAKSQNGARQLIRLVKKNELSDDVRFAAAVDLHRSRWRDVREQAAKIFPLPVAKDAKPLPSISNLIRMRGDAKRGAEIFKKTGTCATCHMVGKEGKEVGPTLSEIGSKLSREALFESILFPSAGISHNYETRVVVLKNGDTSTGILVSEDKNELTLRGADAISRTFKKSDVVLFRKEKTSMMPADLQKLMSAQDLADVVEYTARLKKAK
jgi:putative membrane-bound dehydrogenase-like protein